MKPVARRPGAESAIGLINIVFLMLIFFLIAGTIGRAPDAAVQLIQIRDGERTPPRDALVLTVDGTLRHDYAETTVEAYLASLTDEPRVARILPDRDAPAARLITLAQELRAAGVERVIVLGEGALE